jgi:molecular chaperone GrpE
MAHKDTDKKNREIEEEITLENEDLDDSVVEEEHVREKVKNLQSKLKSAEEKAKEYLDSWQRDKADFLNMRKRDEEDKREYAKFATTGLISDVLPVLDSFELALIHGNKDVKPVYDLLQSILRQHGLEVLDPMLEAFNPRFHEALGVVETEKKEEDNHILEVVQKGYIISGKVIRPAKVRIGEYKAD